MRELERGFRKESFKGRSSWSQFKPVNPSSDPYVLNSQNGGFRDRLHHKELDKRSPLELRNISEKSKLHKPF